MNLKSFLLGTAGALLVLASASVAQADTGFGQVGQFGSEGTGDGQFRGPAGVAVDQASNDVYVVDRGDNRVEKFEASGAFVSIFGADVGGPGVNVCTTACGPGTQGSGDGQFSSPSGITVDSSGNVYVVDSANNRVEKFSSSGAYLSQLTATDPSCTQGFSNPTAVALAPASGALYVTDTGNNRVVKVDPATGLCDGVFDSSIAASGTFSSPLGVATDSAGAIYVLDSGNARVEKFDPTGVLLSALDNGGSPLALAVDATSKDVYVADASGTAGTHIIQYNSTGTVLETFGFGKLTFPQGLTVDDALSKVFVTNVRFFSSSPEVLIFGQTTLPHTVTGAASGVTASSATVAGTVNPEGTETSYFFQYGLDTTYSTGCSTPPCSSPSTSAGSGTSAVEATANLSELQPNITYHYRLAATNTSGGRTFGADKTFTTEGEAPTILGESSSGVGPTAATLEALINPNNQDTTYKFQYSTSPTLENPTLVSGASALSGFTLGGQSGRVEVGALTPSTVYYYQVIAENGTGQAKPPAAIEQFETLPPPPSATTGGVSSVTRTGATLVGTVNPEGPGPSSETTWCFQYGTDTTYASGIAGAPGNAGQGTSPVDVTAALNGLAPHTTYHYRLVAVNNVNTTGSSTACNTRGGYETDGEDQSFTTVALAPAVTTGLVVEATATTAILGGGIVPQGVDALYHFEYGTTMAYGSNTPMPDGDAGSALNTQYVTAGIAGLAPGTSYHYRLVASSSGGTTYGWDQTLTTFPPVPAASTGPASMSSGGQSAPIIAFPNLSGFAPMPPPPAKTTITPKALTKAQKLTKALKACKKAKSKSKRTACEKQARKKYAPPKKRK
jgi:DNA-binding beta-propeller fold protein YncE